MLPLTFITGLYGMNVNLPLAEKNEMFFLLAGIMILIVISMMSFFKFKKWI
jgi:magnesium transporter